MVLIVKSNISNFSIVGQLNWFQFLVVNMFVCKSVFWDISLEHISRCAVSAFGYTNFTSHVIYFQFVLQNIIISF